MSSDPNIPEEIDEYDGRQGFISMPPGQIPHKKIFDFKDLIKQEIVIEKQPTNLKTEIDERIAPKMLIQNNFEDLDTPIIHATSSPKIRMFARQPKVGDLQSSVSFEDEDANTPPPSHGFGAKEVAVPPPTTNPSPYVSI